MTKIKIEPAYKKSVVEIEFFKNDDNVWIHVETGWRWGTFFADVTDEEMKGTLNFYENTVWETVKKANELNCTSNVELTNHAIKQHNIV